MRFNLQSHKITKQLMKTDNVAAKLLLHSLVVLLLYACVLFSHHFPLFPKLMQSDRIENYEAAAVVAALAALAPLRASKIAFRAIAQTLISKHHT